MSGHKEHDACLQYPPLSTICNSLGSRWRSSPAAGVTNSQSDACGADLYKRYALSVGVDLHKVMGTDDAICLDSAVCCLGDATVTGLDGETILLKLSIAPEKGL